MRTSLRRASAHPAVNSAISDGVTNALRRVRSAGAAVRIGRRTMGIPRQSVVAGMALRIAARVAAALGYLPPVAGALPQEASTSR